MYLLLFVAFYQKIGPKPGFGYFILFPLITIALAFGIKGGIVMGLLAHPLNLLVQLLMGGQIGSANFSVLPLFAWVMAIAVGACVGYMCDVNLKYRQANRMLKQTNRELQQAMTEIKKLSGLLPICAKCKKIRDDQGYWNQIEFYISEHSEADFSHGICPGCAEKLYPGIPLGRRTSK